VTARLWLADVRLTDFRNHPEFRMELDDRPVCLIGPNGAGKTNVLEAISALAPGRGLRGAPLGDMARRDGAEMRARGWVVYAQAVLDEARHALAAASERGPDGALKRVARLDGRAAGASEIGAIVRLSWVTPAMDRLFAGPPGDRRRFFDRLAFAFAPEHGASAAAYERALRERQRLLQEGSADRSWLDALEQEMAVHAAAVAQVRARTMAALAAEIAARPEGAFPKAALDFTPGLEKAFAGGAASADLEDGLARTMRANRARDAAAGRALEGPHRTDLLVHHAAKRMPAQDCSTGEQKALLLGIILAHARALAADPGAGPALLMLDEAAAHLDAARRVALFEELLKGPGQAWLTGTDQVLFEAFGDRAQTIALTPA
jgi:DNA replication and repair protein RecF